jgi:TolB-like protein
MVKRIVLGAIALLALGLTAVSAQDISLDDAIKAAGMDIIQNMEDGSVVAIINFVSPSEALSQYVVDELTSFLVQSKTFIVADRARLDLIRSEQNFQMSGDVSDASMQSIGKMFGARYIITGSFTRSGHIWRFGITGLSVEGADIKSMYRVNVVNSPQIESWISGKQAADPKAARLWTLGVSVGSSFATPWIIATVHGTIAPFKYSFLELGCDIGWISSMENAVYYSLYPFAHYSLFLPIGNNSGWYIGAGGGWMYGSYTVDDLKIPVSSGALHFTTGFNILNFIDVSYTLRTNFKSVNHKASVGFVYRFK